MAPKSHHKSDMPRETQHDNAVRQRSDQHEGEHRIDNHEGAAYGDAYSKVHPYTFQNRCSPKRFTGMLDGLFRCSDPLTSSVRGLLREIGFSGLIKVNITRLDRGFLDNVLQLYDKKSKTFRLGDGKVLGIGPNDVKRVYGLPAGKLPIRLEGCCTGLAKKLGKELGLSHSSALFSSVKDLYDNIMRAQDPENIVKMFVLYALGVLLSPVSVSQVNLNYAEFMYDLQHVTSYNWCEHVSDVLINGLDRYADHGSKGGSPLIRGDIHFLFIHFLDCILVGDETTCDIVPSCGRWTKDAVAKKLRGLQSIGDIHGCRVIHPVTSTRHPSVLVTKPGYSMENPHADSPCRDVEVFDKTLSEAIEAQGECIARIAIWNQRLATLVNHVPDRSIKGLAPGGANVEEEAAVESHRTMKRKACDGVIYKQKENHGRTRVRQCATPTGEGVAFEQLIEGDHGAVKAKCTEAAEGWTG